MPCVLLAAPAGAASTCGCSTYCGHTCAQFEPDQLDPATWIWLADIRFNRLETTAPQVGGSSLVSAWYKMFRSLAEAPSAQAYFSTRTPHFWLAATPCCMLDNTVGLDSVFQ